MSTSTALLDPQFRPWAEYLLQVGRRYGLRPRVTSTFRSIREQARLYEKFLRGETRYPVAPPGHSLHNYGLAIDLVSHDNPWLGEVWQSWGGRWSSADSVHFGI